ncbi:alpha-L-fucosidase [Micromonospora sp. NPDC047740]|uniref:alpha-L-fucosidase n=1 Tax=Micromonospora sp. NPDC047740 TaxID=3364254 RepID=UPI00371813BC
MRKTPISIAFTTLVTLSLATPVAAANPSAPILTTSQTQASAEPDYEPTPESLNRHQAPRWFDDAKLGFFIHWGPYSVPAFAPKSGGRAYAEWYWSEMNKQTAPTHRHHADTYGEDFPYDRFIEQWKPDKFKPQDWLDLFVEGGAKYFVLVSKHHDGVALWDTATTDRSTVALGPHRDLVRELFDAAEDYPLKKGLYYSLPEWYHPAGGRERNGPINPYTREPIPYTGYKPVHSYVMDHQYPQMRELVDRFDPDIFWCDLNGPNNSNELMAYYFNQAKNRPSPKDVTVNNRCGNGISDFTTPEYRVEADINPQKWEATRGLGKSFGYNAEEGPDDYLSADELIDSFVDIVSKNGNLLLNLGPKADGTIPEVQAERVRALGSWLKTNGEAIHGSTYWNHAEDARSNVPVRYTVKDEALYVTALQWPGTELTLSDDLPLANNSTITLLGSNGRALPWRKSDDAVTISMPGDGASATTSTHAYTFKITTPEVRQVLRTKLDAPKNTEPGLPFTTKLTVTNPSKVTAPDGRLALQVPPGWSVTPERTVVKELPAGASRTVEFQVRPTANTEPDRYTLTASASFGRTTYQVHRSLLVGFDYNLALGKPTSQKSLYQGSNGNPERAVDGNTNGVWSGGSVTHTAQPESEAWWQVDLQQSYQIGEIALWNRTDCCSTRLSNYYVFVSDTPFTSDSVAGTLAQPGVRAFHHPETAASPTRIPVGMTGRYVRVQLTSASDPLSLAEVEVFGRRPS